MKWISMLVLLSVPLGGCATAGPSIAPAELVGHLSDEPLSTMAANWPKRTEAPSIAGELVVLQIPQREDIGADTQQYFLYKGKQDNQFWIMVSGGYTGQRHWRGPIPLDSIVDDG